MFFAISLEGLPLDCHILLLKRLPVPTLLLLSTSSKCFRHAILSNETVDKAVWRYHLFEEFYWGTEDRPSLTNRLSSSNKKWRELYVSHFRLWSGKFTFHPGGVDTSYLQGYPDDWTAEQENKIWGWEPISLGCAGDENAQDDMSSNSTHSDSDSEDCNISDEHAIDEEVRELDGPFDLNLVNKPCVVKSDDKPEEKSSDPNLVSLYATI